MGRVGAPCWVPCIRLVGPRLSTRGCCLSSGTATPLPYNRVGEILEKRKDFKGALEAYTQSLKVEWNQPPTGEAIRRLEKALNP